MAVSYARRRAMEEEELDLGLVPSNGRLLQDLPAGFVAVPPARYLWTPGIPGKPASLAERMITGRNVTCASGQKHCDNGDFCCPSQDVSCGIESGHGVCCLAADSASCVEVCESTEFQCNNLCCTNGQQCLNTDQPFPTCAWPTSSASPTSSTPPPPPPPTTAASSSTTPLPPPPVSSSIPPAATSTTPPATPSSSPSSTLPPTTSSTPSSTTSTTISSSSTSHSSVHSSTSSVSASSITSSTPAAPGTPSPSASSDADSTASNGGGLSTGAKAAIGVVVPIAVILILLGLWLLLRRRRQNAADNAALQPGDYYSPPPYGQQETQGNPINEMSATYDPNRPDARALSAAATAAATGAAAGNEQHWHADMGDVEKPPGEDYVMPPVAVPIAVSPRSERYEMSSTPAQRNAASTGDPNHQHQQAPVPPWLHNDAQATQAYYEMSGSPHPLAAYTQAGQQAANLQAQYQDGYGGAAAEQPHPGTVRVSSTDREIANLNANLSSVDEERFALEQRQMQIANERERLMRLEALDREEAEVRRRLEELRSRPAGS